MEERTNGDQAKTLPASKNGGTQDERALEHFLQLDHWTFLLAFALVVINVFTGSRKLSAAASTLLAVSIGYDIYEFRNGE